jgi:UDP-glucose 4-epimerase
MSNGIKRKRILLTGSRGFIGSYAMAIFKAKGYEVRGYDIIDGEDIVNIEKLRKVSDEFKPQVIVHFAGQVYLKPSLDNPQKDAVTNIVGMLNVLEVARQHNCLVIFSSSGAIYGSNDRSNISETHDPEPVSPYGVSKWAAERYVQLYNYLYKVPFVIFRFSSVYGKGRAKTSVNLIADKAVHNDVIKITGSGMQTRDFTHVSDVVEAVRMAVNEEIPCGIYNVGTGVSTSINGLVSILEQLLNKKLVTQYVEEVKADPPKNDFNIEKISRYGFKAKTSLRDGLSNLIEELK